MPIDTNFLYNKIKKMETDIVSLQDDVKDLNKLINDSYLTKTTYNGGESEREVEMGDLQNRIREVERKVTNVLLPEETKAYLGIREIRLLRSGFAETQGKIEQMENLKREIVALIAKVEARWPLI